MIWFNDYNLAILFATAHLETAGERSSEEARDILAAYALESGLPALSSRLAGAPDR